MDKRYRKYCCSSSSQSDTMRNHRMKMKKKKKREGQQQTRKTIPFPSSAISVPTALSSTDPTSTTNTPPPPTPLLTSSPVIADLIECASELARLYGVARRAVTDKELADVQSLYDASCAAYKALTDKVLALDTPAARVAVRAAIAIIHRRDPPLWTALPPSSPSRSRQGSPDHPEPLPDHSLCQFGLVDAPPAPPLEPSTDYSGNCSLGSDSDSTVDGPDRELDMLYYEDRGCPACFESCLLSCTEDCVYRTMFMSEFNKYSYKTNVRMFSSAVDFMAKDRQSMRSLFERMKPDFRRMNELLNLLAYAYDNLRKGISSQEEVQDLCKRDIDEFCDELIEIIDRMREEAGML